MRLRGRRRVAPRAALAVLAAGVAWPARRITVNLAPSGTRKVGSGLDLAIAVAALATVVSLLTSLATPDFTAGAPADDGYQGKHEAPDPRHHVAD